MSPFHARKAFVFGVVAVLMSAALGLNIYFDRLALRDRNLFVDQLQTAGVNTQQVEAFKNILASMSSQMTSYCFMVLALCSMAIALGVTVASKKE